MFRNQGGGLGQRWTETRPPGAVYVAPEEETPETPQDEVPVQQEAPTPENEAEPETPVEAEAAQETPVEPEERAGQQATTEAGNG